MFEANIEDEDCQHAEEQDNIDTESVSWISIKKFW